MTPLTLPELQARIRDLGLTQFRILDVSRDFGHDPVSMLRAADEAAYAIVERRKMRLVGNNGGAS